MSKHPTQQSGGLRKARMVIPLASLGHEGEPNPVHPKGIRHDSPPDSSKWNIEARFNMMRLLEKLLGFKVDLIGVQIRRASDGVTIGQFRRARSGLVADINDQLLSDNARRGAPLQEARRALWRKSRRGDDKNDVIWAATSWGMRGTNALWEMEVAPTEFTDGLRTAGYDAAIRRKADNVTWIKGPFFSVAQAQAWTETFVREYQ